MYILTAEQMKDAEEACVNAGSSYFELMENAGSKVFERIVEYEGDLKGKICVVLCGSGNNGGDGFVVARHMYEVGANVVCVLANGMPKSQLALDMYNRLMQECNVSFFHLFESEEDIGLIIKKSSIVVDAIFGTGFKGEFKEKPGFLSSLLNAKYYGDIAFLAEVSNRSRARIYSIDIPSGMETDRGRVCDSCFEATVTLALGNLKIAHIMNYDRDYLGQVDILDIGIDEKFYSNFKETVSSIDEKYVYSKLRPRNKYSNKGDNGKLICVCGSLGMTGAAKLVTQSAYKSGAGYVYLACPESVVGIMSTCLTEQIIVPLNETEIGSISSESAPHLVKFMKSMTACVVGPGMRMVEDTVEIVREIVKNTYCPIIIDADGINAVASDIDILWTRKSDIVLTPHPGEMARLIGKSSKYVNENRVEVAREFSEKYRVFVVLKGRNTVISSPSGNVYVNFTGNAGMAKAGSGDILAGMIGSLAAQNYGVLQASILGTFLHGSAADYTADRLSLHSMTASDVLDDYHVVFKKCDG